MTFDAIRQKMATAMAVISDYFLNSLLSHIYNFHLHAVLVALLGRVQMFA